MTIVQKDNKLVYLTDLHAGELFREDYEDAIRMKIDEICDEDEHWYNNVILADGTLDYYGGASKVYRVNGAFVEDYKGS